MFKTTQSAGVGRGALALTLFVGAGCLFFASSTYRGSAACPTTPQWKQIGPAPLIINPAESTDGKGPDSGEVNDIAIDPRGSNDQTIYAAVGDGGIWKSTDGGTTWSPKTDLMPSLSMGTVALDPGTPSIVYAGTGNPFTQNWHGIASQAVGIYKSINGGDTWTNVGANILTGTGIFRMVLPAPNVLLVASDNGLYRSVDGGLHFGANAPFFDDGRPIPLGPSGSSLTFGIAVTDLKVDTASSSIVYVAVALVGMFKSTDGGATFTNANFFTAANGATDDLWLIKFAQSTSPNNHTMYANVELASNPGLEELYKADLSIDPSANKQWKRLTTNPTELSVEGFYAQTVGVDPHDANRFYYGNRSMYRITDGGAGVISEANRIGESQIHADQHAFAFSPPSHVTTQITPFYVGNDGGIAATGDGGDNWTTLNGSADCSRGNGALATILFRQIDIGRGSTANNAYTYGVAQDLGVSSHTPDCPGIRWLLGNGGDGTTVAVDPANPQHAISHDDCCFFATVDGKSWQTGGSGLAAAPALVYFDPNGGIAYAVIEGNPTQLYQSTDNGSSFVLMHTFDLAGAKIDAINMVKIDSNTIWVGRDDGTVWYTTTANNGAASAWGSFLAPGVQGPVSGIAIDPLNTAQVVFVTASATGQAFMTTNNGATWASITGNLPRLPFNSVVIDPNKSPHSIIVGTDAGVLQTSNFGASWNVLGVGLPAVNCTSLAIDSTATPSLLRVGTYGRSAFELAYDRQYVDWRNNGAQDGTREHPFQTVTQAVNAPATGDARIINIQSGTYHESVLTISQCGTLAAINGPVTIQ